MYRINLYPEYAQRREGRRRGLLRILLVSLLIAVDAALVVALFITGTLLAERAASLRVEITRLEAAVRVTSEPPPAAAAARELLEVRRGRMDWSPKLAACSERIDRMLLLTGIEARAAGKHGDARLEVTGTLRGTPPDLQAVPRFMEALRSDPRIQATLPDVQLGTMEGGESGRFEIVCQAPRKTEES